MLVVIRESEGFFHALLSVMARVTAMPRRKAVVIIDCGLWEGGSTFCVLVEEDVSAAGAGGILAMRTCTHSTL